MDHQFYIENLQYCNENGANDCTDFTTFIGNCLCNLLKALCVSGSALLFITVIVVAILLLIWLIRLVSLWLNPKFYNHPQLMAPRYTQCYGEPCGRSIPTGERVESKATDRIQNETIIIIGAYLEMMDSAIKNICNDEADQQTKEREMLKYQTILLCLKQYEVNIQLVCNSKIDALIKQLSDCLDKMTDCINKNDNAKKKQIEDSFKEARAGLEALLMTDKK